MICSGRTREVESGGKAFSAKKSTALVSVIAGRDLLTAVQTVYQQNYQVIPLLAVAAIWYLALVSLLSVGQFFLERRFGRGDGSQSKSIFGGVRR